MTIDGALPARVADALGDLSDERLHLDPAAEDLRVTVEAFECGWTIAPRSATPAGANLAAEVGDSNYPADEADLTDRLVTRLNRLAFDLDPRRVHLHAALAELEGVGLLLAGASGSGKSTVVTELLLRGASYATDECATLLPGSLTVYGYPKPITLKAGSFDHFGRTSPTTLAAIQAAREGQRHLRASRITSTTPHVRVGVIVLLRHSSFEPPHLRPISAAEACVRLLADSFDGIRVGPAALEVVGQVAAGASTWDLVFDDAASAAELIAEIRAPSRRQLVVPHRLRRKSDFGAGSPPLAHQHSSDRTPRVVKFDDSAALSDGPSRRLLVLQNSQMEEIEDGRPGTALDQLPEGLGRGLAARASTRSTTFGFGLANYPTGALHDARPIGETDAVRAEVGLCTGVLAEQVVRGRATRFDRTTKRILRAHETRQSACLALEGELPRLVSTLEGAGVEPLVLNGPVSAHDGQFAPWWLDFRGLDLLVLPTQLEAALAALCNMGLHRSSPTLPPSSERRTDMTVKLHESRSEAVGHPTASGLVVNVHQAIAPDGFGELIPTADLYKHAVPTSIHRRWYRTLHPDHRFAHACLRLVLSRMKPRIDQLREVALTAPVTPTGIDAAVDLAVRWRTTPILRRAISLVDAAFPNAFAPMLVASLGPEQIDADAELPNEL